MGVCRRPFRAHPVLIEPVAQPHPFARPRGFTVAKRPGDTNEDCWQNSHKGAGAVSDGASVSFDSAAWSRILARRYARHPCVDDAWVAEAIAAYAKLHDRDSLPWMQQAAFDRGSFASLLGVTDRRAGRIGVLAIGDSLAVLCDGDHVVASFPYEAPEQFDAQPQLLSTNPAENGFLAEPDCLSRLSLEWDLGPLDNPALLCVTDALGCWILSQRDRQKSPIAWLRGIASRRAFAHFVEEERTAGRMRRDDTTLLAYWDWSATAAGGTAPC
jgi:hypothetical protein